MKGKTVNFIETVQTIVRKFKRQVVAGIQQDFYPVRRALCKFSLAAYNTFSMVLHRLWQILHTPGAFLDKARQTVDYLQQNMPHYNWVGIYMVQDTKLHLLCYRGFKATEHTQIDVHQGLCGAAVREKKILNIPDVNQDPRYLACFSETRSELIVPLRCHDLVFGEIDVDSFTPHAFSKADEFFLGTIARDLSKNWLSNRFEELYESRAAISKGIMVTTRVRYSETDQMGVVYHANYFYYFELGRVELLRALGTPYALLEKQGVLLAVTESSARHLGRLEYDELVTVRTYLQDLSRTSITLGHEVWNEKKAMVATGSIHLVAMDRATRKVTSLPESILNPMRSLLLQIEPSFSSV